MCNRIKQYVCVRVCVRTNLTLTRVGQVLKSPRAPRGQTEQPQPWGRWDCDLHVLAAMWFEKPLESVAFLISPWSTGAPTHEKKMLAFACAWNFTPVHTCMHACMRACSSMLHACMRACMCACIHAETKQHTKKVHRCMQNETNRIGQAPEAWPCAPCFSRTKPTQPMVLGGTLHISI